MVQMAFQQICMTSQHFIQISRLPQSHNYIGAIFFAQPEMFLEQRGLTYTYLKMTEAYLLKYWSTLGYFVTLTILNEIYIKM